MSWSLLKNGRQVSVASDLEWGGGEPQFDRDTGVLLAISSSWVRFHAPSPFALGASLTTEWALRDGSGRLVPIQITQKGLDGWVDAIVPTMEG